MSLPSPHFIVMARQDDHLEDRKLADFTDRHRAEIYANGYATALDHQAVDGIRITIEEVE